MPDIRHYPAISEVSLRTAHDKGFLKPEGASEEKFLDALNESLNTYHERKPGDYPEFSEEDYEIFEEWAKELPDDVLFVEVYIDYYWRPNEILVEGCPRKELYFMFCEALSEAETTLSGEE